VEALEDRTLLNAAPTTILDLNGLAVDPSHYSSTDILVRFQSAPGKPGGPAAVAGTTLGGSLPLVSNLYEVNLSKGMTVAQALAAYKAEKGVLDAEPDYNLTVSVVPNDPLLSQQWSLRNAGQSGGTPGADIHAEQAWNVTTGSPKVVVAVMDTGIDYNSPDLYQNIWINQAEIPNAWYTKTSATSGYNKLVSKSQIKTATPGVITFRDLNNPLNRGLVWDNNGDHRIDAGDLLRSISQGGWMSGSTKDGDTAHRDDLFGWNFVSNTNNPLDDNGHGTHVSGILGATGNNATGVSGVDWNVQIMPVKFIGANGDGSVSNFINGLSYAVRHGAKISNNSWEGAPYSAALYDAVSSARLHGQIFVAAAGNEGSNDDLRPDYPSGLGRSLNNVVAVAASDTHDHLASFSNYGVNSVDLAAPGVNILSTLPGGRYGYLSGTSMATPEVTGAMALVWGLHPSWSYLQVIDQVLNTTDKLPSLQGKVTTGGRLDVAAAVGWNLSTRVTPIITSVAASGPTTATMNSLRLTFNEPIDVSSFTAAAVKLTNPSGGAIPVVVRVVANSGDREIMLLFANQSKVGNYRLTINSIAHDLQGNHLTPYVGIITLRGVATYTHSASTPIKPWALASSTFTLPAGTSIGNLQVRLALSYPRDNDLYIYLIAPNGKAVALSNRHGGTGASFSNTVFSDQAATAVSAGKAPFYGSYRPDSPLSLLRGTNTGGTWRLMIRNYAAYSGSLINWSLIITPSSGPTVVKISSVGDSPAAPQGPSTDQGSISSSSAGVKTSSVPSVAAVGAPTVLSTPPSGEKTNTPAPNVPTTDKVFSSPRALFRMLTALLVGKRPSNNSSGNGNA
jgi:subtilisin family serine protease/subtilisin-like proprotein convertase family protein